MIVYLNFYRVLHHENLVSVYGKDIRMSEPRHTLFEWE